MHKSEKSQSSVTNPIQSIDAVKFGNDSTSEISTGLSSLSFEDVEVSSEKIFANLSIPKLVELAISRNEGIFASNGSLLVKTGKFTGRSPNDRYIVDDESTHNSVNWGNGINYPISQNKFDHIFERMKNFTKDKDLFIFDGFVGASNDCRLAVRVLSDRAWQCLFANHIFIKPSSADVNCFKQDYLVLSLNDFRAIPETDGTRSEAFVILNFTKRIVLIGATSYAGEIKKAMFSAMNYHLPDRGILPMHCSANIGKDGKAVLFFGLSGTGKTTLSADPNRNLIGDDEHGWNDAGIFNFEGGCYAKCINLREESEPQIWNAIRFGSIMENVVIDNITRNPNYYDSTITENTRAAYPLDNIPNAVNPSIAQHPAIIVFLVADAFGVFPPVARLTPEKAMYHFLSGYTSKLAGTERGITKPKETFSECFGAPFMPRHPAVYAHLLGSKIRKHNSKVYLVNTGWIGGPYGIGKRIDLKYTRTIVSAILNDLLDKQPLRLDPIFNIHVPVFCPGVPPEILYPKFMWKDQKEYQKQAQSLANMFVRNFSRFSDVAECLNREGPYQK